MPLILGADSLAKSKSWVDAAYAVHDDMKSHTSGATSLGRGAIMCKFTKQKLNTKSSTEAEVVGSSDYLPNTVWTRMFLAEQGYKLTENIFYQDNQSAIRLPARDQGYGVERQDQGNQSEGQVPSVEFLVLARKRPSPTPYLQLVT